MTGRSDTRLALLAVLLLLPGLIFDELFPMLGIKSVLIDIASVAAMLLAGSSVMRNAWRSLRIARQLNISVLMSIAAIGAVIIGAYTEAAVVMVLFVIGEALEGYTAQRGRGLHPQPDGFAAAPGHPPPGQRRPHHRTTGGRSSATRRRSRRGQAGRAHSHGWRGTGGRVGGQSGAHHR